MSDAISVVVVDDDETQLTYTSAVLEREGFVVHRFTDALRALDYCAREAPTLILSDILMPAVGGFEFQSRYAARFPERATPFVFLSSLGDAHTITRGLDAGADDYLQKPVESTVLMAKLRAVLRRRRRTNHSTYRGDLQAFPLPSLLRFCETQGLTGFVDVFIGDEVSCLRFRAGQIDDPNAEATLAKLSELKSANFVVHSLPVDFEHATGGAAKRRSWPPPPDRPVGRVSSIRLSHKLFQVQTELTGDEPPFVVSVVSVDGRTVWKHSERVGEGESAQSLAALIDDMHERIEGRFNERMAEELLKRTAKTTMSRREEFHECFDEGFARFRAQDYPGAIEAWRRALAIEPTNAALPVNIRIAEGRIGATRTA